jgi:hypothetical protein
MGGYRLKQTLLQRGQGEEVVRRVVAVFDSREEAKVTTTGFFC